MVEEAWPQQQVLWELLPLDTHRLGGRSKGRCCTNRLLHGIGHHVRSTMPHSVPREVIQLKTMYNYMYMRND